MKRLAKFFRRLRRDERGAEGLEKLLIIAAIIIPLLGVLWVAKNWISDYASEEAEKVQSQQNYQNNNPTGAFSN